MVNVLSGPIEPPRPFVWQDVAAAIQELRKMPQVEMPLTHRFQDGVYMREIFMPADTYVVGHVHRTKHWNVVLTGRALVSVSGGEPIEIVAPCVFESEAGAQKWLYIVEDMRFMTVHANPAEERDIPTLEETLLEMPSEFLLQKGRQTLDDFRMARTRALESSSL